MGLFGGGGSSSSTKPQYTGIELQTASGTLPVALCYGANRMAPNIVWYGDFTAVQHQESQGGKGLGGAKSTSYTYSASLILGMCEGVINTVRTVWKDQAVNSGYAGLGFSLFTGTTSQTAWSYLTSAHPTQALSYRGLAYLAVANYDLGDTPTVSNHNMEVLGQLWATATTTNADDAAPDQVVLDFLTNARYGVGFPTNSLDTTSITAAASGPAFGTYCKALGLAISPFMTSQDTAANILGRWCKILNTAPVWTGSKLRLVPYGDAEINANGADYLPPITSNYTLTDDDYVAAQDSSTDPVILLRADPADAYNSITINYNNRANAYVKTPLEERDQNAVELYGLRPADAVDTPEICDTVVAGKVLSLLLSRSVYALNTYQFTLSEEYSLIEPMDVVTITLTDSGSGFTLLPVRIQKVTEQDNGDFQIIAEEFAQGVGTAAIYARQAVTAGGVDTNASPGSINAPLIFEPRSDLAQGTPQIWIGASGGSAGVANPLWGGCQVWLSLDGTSYSPIGEITSAGRSGKLVGALAANAGANPDTTHTATVNLAQSAGTLTSVTDTVAQQGGTLSYLDGEIFEFVTATLSGTNTYALSRLYRGLYGTTAAAHATNSMFVRLDDAIFKYILPAGLVGSTLYFKFPSFNVWGNALQSLAAATAYTYTPTGAGFYVPPSGLTATPLPQAVKLAWTTNVQPGIDGYVIYGRSDGVNSFTGATRLGSTTGGTFTHAGLAAGSSWRYWVTTFSNLYGWESSPAGPAGPAVVPTDGAESLTASGTVVQWSAVRLIAGTAGKVAPIVNTTAQHMKHARGIALTGATNGNAVQVQRSGIAIVPAALGLTAGVVYITAGGVLSNTRPTTAGSYYRSIGTTTDGVNIAIHLGTVILNTRGG